jgi:hypothetical protein
MFYVEEEIASSLICPRCKLKFVDPRIIVPCGDTLCNNCIDDLSTYNQLDCPFCHVTHTTPVGGFPPNKTITHLLHLKASDVYRNANVEALKMKLNRIQHLHNDFKSKLDNSAIIVNEHCREMKTKIDLLVETKKMQLDEMRDEYVKRITSYEQECVSNMQKRDTKSLLDAVEEINVFAGKCKDYLKNFKIDEAVVSERAQASDVHIAHLEKHLEQLRGAQFNGQLLKFKANEDDASKTEATIGKFEFERLEVNPKDTNKIENDSGKIVYLVIFMIINCNWILILTILKVSSSMVNC